MDKRFSSPPLFLDGIINLHSQINLAYRKGAFLANRLLGTPIPLKNRPQGFSIFVDFSESQPLDRVRGYFMIKNTILRFLPIEFDKALLFPVHNHGGGDFKLSKGMTAQELEEAAKKRSIVSLHFYPLSFIDNITLFGIKPHYLFPQDKTEISKLDDIGKPYFSFTDIKELAVIDLPLTLLSKHFTLVGTHRYAPFTTNTEIECILFAQLNYESDANAIKVLRWIPEEKGVELDQILGIAPNGGDIFFELGYVSCQGNSDLYTYMIKNNSRILFGKIKDNLISIMGGVKIFQTNNLKYPKCLYNLSLK